MLGSCVGAYGLMRVGEVVTDRGGGRRADGIVSGEVVYPRAEKGAEGVTGEVGDAGPGKGEECSRVPDEDPGTALRNLSTSACN